MTANIQANLWDEKWFTLNYIRCLDCSTVQTNPVPWTLARLNTLSYYWTVSTFQPGYGYCPSCKKFHNEGVIE